MCIGKLCTWSSNCISGGYYKIISHRQFPMKICRVHSFTISKLVLDFFVKVQIGHPFRSTHSSIRVGLFLNYTFTDSHHFVPRLFNLFCLSCFSAQTLDHELNNSDIGERMLCHIITSGFGDMRLNARVIPCSV
jgi:hypothetical protein